MIDIDIDTVELEVAFAAAADVADRVIDDLAEGARAKWVALARERLSATKADYIAGIQPVATDGADRVISLVGWLPNAVERGMSPFDMRDTLLGGGKGKRGKGGSTYRAIPFRHGTPGSGGKGGPPMGSAYGERSEGSLAARGGWTGAAVESLGKSVYAAARRLKGATQSQPFHPPARTSWGARLRAGMAPKLHERHSTDIYSGMVRVRHTYEKATQTKYVTFRTISTNSRADKWLHPGIEARDLASDVVRWVEESAPKMVRRAIVAMMGRP